MKEQKSIIIYQGRIEEFGGVATFLFNFCLSLRDYYKITVVYGDGSERQLNRLSKLVDIKKQDKRKVYTANIVIRNSAWGDVPSNLISLDNRYIEMRHADYKQLENKKSWLSTSYKKWDKVNEVIGCGEFVSQRSNEVLHDHPTTIKNILGPRIKTKRILRLISCTRLDPEKGWYRMLKMAQMMRDARIKFEWNIFTPDKKECKFEEIHFYRPRYDIWDYLSDSDYTVLLSDGEGLPYTVQESLQYKVPCIVTDVGGCTELIKDGINGYVVPLDMNFDINKIKNIPKLKSYENNALQTWLNYLGNGVCVKKESVKDIYPEFVEPKYYLVEALPIYAKFKIMDSELKRIPRTGEQWEVDDVRLKTLTERNSYGVPLVRVIKEIK